MKFLSVLLAGLILTSTVTADCTVRQRVVKTAAAVVVAAPVAVFTPVLVPSYGASYQEPRADQNGEILKALKVLNERLDKLEKGQAPAPAAPQTKAPALELAPGAPAAVITAKCAKCHQQGVESKGGGLVLLQKDGTAAKLDDATKWRVMRQAYKGTMPPAKSGLPPLTDEEVGQLFEHLDGLR